MLCVQPSAQAALTDLRAHGPLNTRPQNPLYLMFLAQPMESPQTLNRDQVEFSLQTTFSNIFEVDTLSTITQHNIDMELWRTALQFTYGLSDVLDVRIELPFLSNSGGFLDGFVQGYHNALGVPNGGREKVANGQFNFSLSHNGAPLINNASSALGLSDATVRFKYLLSDKVHLPFKLALATSLKIPTGRLTHGFGSERFDFGIAVSGEKSLKRFHLTSQIGYVFLGGQKQLNSILRSGFLSFGQSAEFQITDGLSALVQISGNTSAFHSIDSPDLKKIALDINAGFAGAFPLKSSFFDEFFYQWSFSEDILAAGPSVDFSILFLAGFRY